MLQRTEAGRGVGAVAGQTKLCILTSAHLPNDGDADRHCRCPRFCNTWGAGVENTVAP